VNADARIGQAVQRVLERYWYVLGEEVTGFESEFAHCIGVPHCVSVANGTDALELALRALGVKSDDRVVTAANAGFYASTAIHSLGAQPLYADVEEATLTLSPAALEQVLACHSPAAIVVTHLYGQMADMPRIAALCRVAGVPLLEDCAQAHGAQIGGRKAGSWGDIAAFSFYPTKNLGALGDGGAVVTSSDALATQLRALRQYGWKGGKYQVAVPGGCNSRLDEIQAAALRVKLPLLDQYNALRRRIAARYSAAFASLPLRCLPSEGEDYVAHLYVVRTPCRDALRVHLQAQGIASDIHYPIPDHRQKGYPCLQQTGGLRTTESACSTVLSLPCYPGLSDEAVSRVIAAVVSVFTEKPR
jgi:dTDP-4-amino-4,6-dideoxygalactose transaminase